MFHVKFKSINDYSIIPSYKHEGDSGFDLHACESFTISYNQITLVHTGLQIELPKITGAFSLELQIRPRSGFARKYGIMVINSPGTIDFGYRGEIIILLTKITRGYYSGSCGERIAQGIICPVLCNDVVLYQDVKLSESERGKNGFGSTGLK